MTAGYMAATKAGSMVVSMVVMLAYIPAVTWVGQLVASMAM